MSGMQQMKLLFTQNSYTFKIVTYIFKNLLFVQKRTEERVQDAITSHFNPPWQMAQQQNKSYKNSKKKEKK